MHAFLDRKTVVMTNYGITRGFFLIEPGMIPAGKEDLASLLDGIDRYWKMQTLDELKVAVGERNGRQECQRDAPDVDLFHQHWPEQARAQAVQDRRNAEHRVIAVAREQAPDKVGHKADQRAGNRPEEHARDEDRHGLEREARRLIRSNSPSRYS